MSPEMSPGMYCSPQLGHTIAGIPDMVAWIPFRSNSMVISLNSVFAPHSEQTVIRPFIVVLCKALFNSLLHCMRREQSCL